MKIKFLLRMMILSLLFATGGGNLFAQNQNVDYEISTKQALIKFAENVNAGNNYEGKVVVLTADITLTNEWTPIGNGSRSNNTYTGNSFKGTFDGGKHTITGLKITSGSSNETKGLFGVVDGGTVKNLKLENVSINTSSKNAGAAVGLMVNNSKVDNVEVSGEIIAVDGVGGVVGRMIIDGTISNCINKATVKATDSGAGAGGIVGKAYYSALNREMNITSCTNNGNVTSGYAAGGITALSAANVSNCSNTAEITAGTEGGGIIGEQSMYGTVNGNTNSGLIKNNGTAGFGYGGIIGWARYAGNVTDYPLNGIINVTNNTNTANIEASAATGGSGGIVGHVYNQANVIGNTNKAEYIHGGVFAAGIVGSLQQENNNLDIENTTITVSGNVSLTSMENITVSGTIGNDLIAYNNDAANFVVKDNLTNSPVAQIGDQKFATLAAALTAASNMTGDVTVEIYEKVTLNTSLSGNYTSINFVGKDTDAEIYLDVQGYITATGKKVAFEDLILSKSAGGFIDNAGFRNVAFGVNDVTEVTYTRCNFANGAYASSGIVTYNYCTFMRSHDKYGLWAYCNVDVTVNGGKFDDYRGIKMYAEGTAKTVDLTVKNVNFSAVTDKPAIVLTYGKSVNLENNTYSTTGVFELDKDGAPNGTPINYIDDNEKLTCKNDDGPCGVLVDGKIYTTVAQAADVAISGSTVTLLHNSTETVTLPAGVTLDKNGYTADGVTEAAPDLIITTAQDLINFAKDVNENNNKYESKVVALGANINLNGNETNLWTPIGKNGDSEPKFYGIFDGKGYVISNLYVKQDAAYHAAGLFGATRGTIKNFTIDGAYVESLSSGNSLGATVNGTAVVAGSTAYGATIENVHVKNATVKGNRYVAGIVGYMDGAVRGCSVENVTIVATPDKLSGNYDNGDKVGGIVGYTNSAATEIASCELKGTVSIKGYRDIGGIVGTVNSNVVVSDNTNSASISITVDQNTGYYGDKDANAGEFIGRGTASSESTDNTRAEGATYTVETIPYTPATKVAAKDELNAAISAAKEGDVIEMTADIDYGTDQLKIEKAITLDLGEKTLTTRNAYGGMSIKNNPTIKNGNIVHASNTAAIKVWNATAFEDLVIDVQDKGDANKTIGGIVLQEGATTRVGSIKNVTIKGDALTNGIETYNCGNATENVIGAMENVTINAVGTAMLISAPCGTATNCTFNGGVNGVEIWIKGNYSASLDLVNCNVVGGVFAHDEFNSNPGVVNNGTLNLTADEATTGAAPEDVTLTIARAENLDGVIKEVMDNAKAKINDTYYLTLQAAINAAVNGGVVTLLADNTENVTVTQKPDVNFTIDGAQQTMTGAITVDGKSTTIMSAGVTIKNVKFNANNITTDAAINLGVSGNNNTRYTCNVTVEKCTFTGTGQTKVAVKSYTGGDKNLTITNCNVDNTMHSLAQVAGVENVTITNTVVKSKNGINVNSSTGNIVINECEIDVTGYAFRTGVANNNAHVAPKISITESTLKSAEEMAVEIRANVAEGIDLTMTRNVVVVAEGQPHITGTAAKSKVNADANYWGEGLTGPVVAEGSAPVVVNSYYSDADREHLIVTALTLQQFVEKVAEGNGTYNGTFTEGGVEKNITVKVVPVSGDAGTTEDVRVPNRLQKYTNPDVYYAQYQRFGELTDVNISNVNFVFYPAAVTVTDDWNTAGATTTADNINGELQLMNTGVVSFADCSFEKMSVSPISAATLSVTSSTFNGLDAYAIKDINATTATITGTTFTDCNGGFWFNNAPTTLTVTGNTFTGTGRRGAIQFSANGDYANTAMNVTGNNVTDNAAFLWQLNSTISNAQLTAILDKNNNTYTTAFVTGSVELHLQGEGTADNPYLINDISDLEFFRYDVNAGNNYAGKYVKLAANINLEGENWTPIGDITYNKQYQPADASKVFSGTFDGDNKVISNLAIEKIIGDGTNPDEDANVGFFGITGEGAVIKNLTFTHVNIKTSGRNVGTLAGFAYKTTLDNITVNGNIQIKGGNNVSGVVSMSRYYDMSATNIKVEGNDGSAIVGNNIVGGIFAEIAPDGSAQTFENLSVENVAITGVGGVGGIVGLLTTGTVNTVSVKNVVLTGRTDYQGDAMGRIRLGSVAGLLGNDYATIANATTENVTAKNLDNTQIEDLPIIGANYDASSNATEAKIGDTYYATLQIAINAAKADDNTIQLLADITDDVAILQQEGKNIVIDGKKNDTGKYTFNGTINIYGDARISGEETLTIQNINFYTEDNARYFIHAYDNGQIEGTNNHKQYAHNVTVENCKFATSTGNKHNTIVGMRFRQANDMSAVNCTSDGIFSIMWTTAVDGLKLNGVEATNCTEGITIGGASKKVNIIGTKIESDTYAIRAEGAGSDFIIENSTLVAKVPVVVRNVTENSMISFTFNGTNTITESNPTNYWFVAGETEYIGASEVMPTAPKGQVNVTLNDTGLRYEDVYGNYYELAGEGTADNPYTIANLYELKFFRNQVNAGNSYAGKYVKLTDDIDLAEGQNRSTVSNWEPISTFNGVFDGNDKTIYNLVVNGEGKNNQGFFGQTNNGEIKNLTINNAKVTGRQNVGVVAGTPYTSKYTNIKVTGHVEVNGMSYVGGVGGKNAYANWTDITVDVDGESYVKATSTENSTAYRTYVGGVIGFNGEGGHTFKNIASNINVIGDVCDIGGIFGIAHYGNKFEIITHSGTVTNTNSNAEDVVETGLIAGVWHNQAGTSVTFTNTTSTGTISVPNVTGVTFPNDGLIGAAYTTSNETSSTSGSLTINGEQVYPYVAKIDEVGYNTLAKAITAAQSDDVVTLLWVEGDAPIAMNASLYGKDVTITGTATVDWSKGWLFVGRGGAGDATLTFDNAKLTSNEESLANGTYGIHVSAKEGNDVNKNYGKVIFKNSDVQLSYLANRNNVEVDGGKLYVHYGFWVGGRPSTETPDGSEGTATMDIKNGAVVEVNNHNGMGIGHEGNGVMNITSSTFKYTGTSFNLAKEDNSSINVYGESTIEITTLEGGSSIDLNEGAIVKNSTVGGEVYIAGNVTFRGDNTFAMISDYGDYYSQETPSMWTVEEGASLTLTNNNRYGLGYGDKVTVIGNIENALEARATLTDEDASVNMYGGLVGMTNSATPNAENSFTATNAYLIFGVNGDKSFGNKPGDDCYGNYTFTFNNSVVTANGFKFYEDNGTSTVKFSNSDLLVNGVLMTNDASSKFTFENSVVLSMATSNGTDDKNQNAGVMTLTNTQFTYSAAFTNVGTLNLDLSSKLTAPSVAGDGIINIDATNFDGNDICVISADMASFEGVINVEGAHYMKKADGIYVTGAQGTLTKAYTSATGYWGECGGNANESFVLRFYNDNTYMGQTSLNDIDNIIDGDVYVTWSIDLNIDPNAEGYWAMSWDIRPTLAMQPNRVEQWVDGEKVAECVVEPNWADNIFPVVAAVTGENDVILSYVNNTTGATLKDAFAAGGNIAILRDFNLTESVTVPSGKTVVLNLNGKTMSQTKACEASYEMINNKGNLTITGEGKISFIDTGAGDPNFVWGSYTVRNEGNLVVENGTIEHLGAHSFATHCIMAIFQYSGSSTIKGGTISTPTYRSVRLWKGDMTINGGTFDGQLWVQCVDDLAELTINGGNFSPRGSDGSSVFVGNVTNAGVHHTAKFTVTGGTFETKIGCSDTDNLTGDRIIGGLFSQSAVDNTNEALLGEGFAFNGTQNAEGYYTVIQVAGTQTREFATPGWYWFSTYINLEGEDGLNTLKKAFDGKASQIKGQEGFTDYYNVGGGAWTPGLSSISAADMYMIKTKSPVTINLTGDFVEYEQFEIDLKEGWNWLGFPLSKEVNINDAFATMDLQDGDEIKGKNNDEPTSRYYIDFDLGGGETYTGWDPTFNMKPGHGYMFKSVNEKSFRYSSNSTRSSDSGLKTINYNGDNHWFADAAQYPNNMSIVAMLSIDGEIVKDNYEVAAFAKGECRGSARPYYVEALDSYVLYMTIHGENVENLTFKYYDVNYGTEYEISNTIVYSNNASIGSLREPYMFNLGILNIDESSVENISIYPNPTTTGKEINLQAVCDKVEVFNALGVKVAEYTNVDSIDAIETAGIYVIRVTIDGNARNCRLIVK